MTSPETSETPSECIGRLIRALSNPGDLLRVACQMVESAGESLEQAGICESLPETHEIAVIVENWLAGLGSTADCDKAVALANALAKKAGDETTKVSNGTHAHYLAASHLAHMLREYVGGLDNLPGQRLDWIASNCREAVSYARSRLRWSRAREQEALWQIECLKTALELKPYEMGARVRNSLLTV